MLLYYGTLPNCGVKHALMREVADLESGNFRGVCPILNRANGIMDTVCGLESAACVCTLKLSLCLDMLITARKLWFFEFFYKIRHETHGNVDIPKSVPKIFQGGEINGSQRKDQIQDQGLRSRYC